MEEPTHTFPAATCPLCGTNDRVAPEFVGGVRVQVCSTCWTVFEGGTGEWNRCRRIRERRRQWIDNAVVD